MGAINEVIVRTVENGYILWWYGRSSGERACIYLPFPGSGPDRGPLAWTTGTRGLCQRA